MNTNNFDVIWNYLATFFKIASAVLLFPFILNKLPSETVGIWNVFITITSLAAILDFGFSSTFSRNISYVFTGVKELKVKGYEKVVDNNSHIDYSLLRALIETMKWFYLRVALLLLIIFSLIGTYYVSNLLKNFSGDVSEIYISWIIVCLLSTYNLYTLYYDSLLIGKGLIKRSKQITILGHISYLITAIILIQLGFGLIAIVSSQAISIFIIRWLSYRTFFTKKLLKNILKANTRSKKEILNVVSPNAIKIGLTSLGGFMVNKSSIIIGSLYLTLEQIASYGITIQLIGLMSSLATIYLTTFQPKIARLRVLNDNDSIKSIYVKGQFFIILTYILGGTVICCFSSWALEFIGSKTNLIEVKFIFLAIIVAFLETIHSSAGTILLSKNEVPFFKASILSGLFTVIMLIVLFVNLELGILTLIIAPGFTQAIYQNWKWPLEVIKDLNLTISDYFKKQSYK